MVSMVQDGPAPNKKRRERVFSYDPDNKNDLKILQLIYDVIHNNQAECFNCKNHYTERSFGGYEASCCKIYGCLEIVGNPHYDADGSRCKDYEKNI